MPLSQAVTTMNGSATTVQRGSWRERRESSSPPAGRALRRALLTCFLRGRPSEQGAAGPALGSGVKLGLLLGVYALVGCVALALGAQTAFQRAVSLHALTFALVGMLMVTASSYIVFGPADAEVLLHRPVSARVLLCAKLGVLVQIAWSFAFALNLVSFWVGARVSSPAWVYVVVHALSTALEGLFCAGMVVLVRTLSARWLGHKRLEGLVTLAQGALVLSIAAVSEAVWRALATSDLASTLESSPFWLRCLPPVWFASIDVAFDSATVEPGWPMVALAVIMTLGSVLCATTWLARDHARGLQALNETSWSPHDGGPRRHRLSSVLDLSSLVPRFYGIEGNVKAVPRIRSSARQVTYAALAPSGAAEVTHRFDGFAALVGLAPLRLWLHDPVTREAFLFTARALVRDRGLRLRFYPGLLPLVIAPLALLLPALRAPSRSAGIETALGCALAGGCLAMLPVLGMKLLGQSGLGLSADIFRAAPLPGPGKLCDGARRAVSCFSSLPVLLGFVLLILLTSVSATNLLLLLPGALLVPVYSLLACTPGRGGPLCFPSAGISSALGHGARILGLSITAFAVSAMALAAHVGGWFWWLMLVEALAAFAFGGRMQKLLLGMRWSTAATPLG